MKTMVSWSSGKDSAWMVHVLRQQPEYELAGLLTTVAEPYQRVAMHAVRVELLQAQADALGLPLWQIPIPSPCSNDRYEQAMAATVRRAVHEGFTHMAFGDLFLEAGEERDDSRPARMGPGDGRSHGSNRGDRLHHHPAARPGQPDRRRDAAAYVLASTGGRGPRGSRLAPAAVTPMA